MASASAIRPSSHNRSVGWGEVVRSPLGPRGPGPIASVASNAALQRQSMGDWLLEAATAYNRDSYEQRDRYASHLLIPGDDTDGHPMEHGVDTGRGPDRVRPEPRASQPRTGGVQLLGACWASHTVGHSVHHAGEVLGLRVSVLGEPHIVNVGDSYSVHHVPEEWTDGGVLGGEGARGSRSCLLGGGGSGVRIRHAQPPQRIRPWGTQPTGGCGGRC